MAGEQTQVSRKAGPSQFNTPRLPKGRIFGNKVRTGLRPNFSGVGPPLQPPLDRAIRPGLGKSPGNPTPRRNSAGPPRERGPHLHNYTRRGGKHPNAHYFRGKFRCQHPSGRHLNFPFRGDFGLILGSYSGHKTIKVAPHLRRRQHKNPHFLPIS